MFEKASRAKFRYPSTKGELTTEQLWDMPLTSKNGFDLDSVAKELNKQLKAQAEESFVTTSSNPLKTRLADQLSVVVAVIKTKQAENAAAVTQASRRKEKEQLLDILHDKKMQELSGLSTEELEARIAALQ